MPCLSPPSIVWFWRIQSSFTVGCRTDVRICSYPFRNALTNIPTPFRMDSLWFWWKEVRVSKPSQSRPRKQSLPMNKMIRFNSFQQLFAHGWYRLRYIWQCQSTRWKHFRSWRRRNIRHAQVGLTVDALLGAWYWRPILQQFQPRALGDVLLLSTITTPHSGRMLEVSSYLSSSR